MNIQPQAFVLARVFVGTLTPKQQSEQHMPLRQHFGAAPTQFHLISAQLENNSCMAAVAIRQPLRQHLEQFLVTCLHM